MAAAPSARMQAMMVHGQHPMPPGQDHPDGDHPCPFAGFALSLAQPFPPAMPALLARRSAAPAIAFAIAAAVGRGLAAPPPPATGPPLLA